MRYLLRPPLAPVRRSTAARAQPTSIVDQLAAHMHMLEQRAERYRREATDHEHMLVAYHVARQEERSTRTAGVRALNDGERERVRSLLTRRQLRLAESIRYERMATALDRVIASVASSACLADIVGAMRLAHTHNKQMIARLESPAVSIDDVIDALADDEEVAASYAAALSASPDHLNGDAIDAQLEELIASSSISNERIEYVSRTLERAPAAPDTELRTMPIRSLVSVPL